MSKIWKVIDAIEFKSSLDCLNNLKKEKINVSVWIEDIIKLHNYKYEKIESPIKLTRKFVNEFNFNTATELQEIYKKAKEFKLKLVPPQIALYSRLKYNEQPNGEWLRFATPFDSMIDSDGTPHLPKLGKSLGQYYQGYNSSPRQ